MITKARFERFKLLRDVEFSLGQFNVLVGENGVGKSSVLEGLHYLLQLGGRSQPNDREPGGRPAALFRRERAPELLASRPDCGSFRLSVETDEVQQFSVAWQAGAANGLGDFRLGLQRKFVEEGVREYPTAEDVDPYLGMLLKDLGELGLDSVVRLRLDAERLAEDHYSDDANPQVGYDGTGLASVLQELQGARDDRFPKIEADLRRIVPAARRIRTVRARIVRRERVRISVDDKVSWSETEREYTGAGVEIDWGHVGWVPARHLSEGTLLALGLCTVVHHRPPSLILLDDLDKALHPKAQRDLVGLLRSVIEANPTLQVLATTHSPFVVDEFDSADVLVVASIDGGSSRVGRLSDHPGWSKKRLYLQSGEFWSAVGEGWVAEPRG